MNSPFMKSTIASQSSQNPTDADGMLQRIQQIQPLLRKNAEQARQQRKVPQENIEALRDAGFFQCRWGIGVSGQ
jgi:hypothetical protein